MGFGCGRVSARGSGFRPLPGPGWLRDRDDTYYHGFTRPDPTALLCRGKCPPSGKPLGRLSPHERCSLRLSACFLNDNKPRCRLAEARGTRPAFRTRGSGRSSVMRKGPLVRGLSLHRPPCAKAPLMRLKVDRDQLSKENYIRHMDLNTIIHKNSCISHM